MKFFEFTRKDYEYIVKEGMLDEEYQKLLEMKIKGYSIVKMADELGISTATVSLKVKNLKDKIRRII